MPSNRPEPARAVLFDLDGTFADTAPDLAAALNRLRHEHGLAPTPIDVLRPHTSNGVRGMLMAGMSIAPTDPRYRALNSRFLEYYAVGLCVETRIFPGIGELINRLEMADLRWGIVTNKQQRFTLPLMRALGHDRRAACIVSGDSSARAKPHAAPLRLAAALVRTAPEHCLYVGDDCRDILAGKAAGMRTVAVRYGYLGDNLPIEDWGADHVIDDPLEIGPLLAF